MSKPLNDSELLAQRHKLMEQGYKENDLYARMQQAAQNYKPGGLGISTSGAIYSTLGMSSSQGLNGTCGPSGQGAQGVPGMLPPAIANTAAPTPGSPCRSLGRNETGRSDLNLDYMVVQKSRAVNKSISKPLRISVELTEIDKGPSLLHRLWHFLSRDDMHDYHKTKGLK